MVAVFAIDCRVDFWEDEGSGFGKGVSGSARGEKGFSLLEHRGERHLLGGVYSRLGMAVEAGRARHFAPESRGTCRLPLGGIARRCFSGGSISFLYVRPALILRSKGNCQPSVCILYAQDVVFCLIGVIRWRFGAEFLSDGAKNANTSVSDVKAELFGR